MREVNGIRAGVVVRGRGGGLCYTYIMQALLSSFGVELAANMALVWGYIWWIVIPALLLPLFNYFWLYYVSEYYIKNLRWVLLHVRVPREIMKTPKAMEQVF